MTNASRASAMSVNPAALLDSARPWRIGNAAWSGASRSSPASCSAEYCNPSSSGSAVGDIHFRGVGSSDGRAGRRAKKHVAADFVGPRVDNLQAVRFRRDDVEFAAIGFEEHVGGPSREFEIGDEEGAIEVDNGKAIFETTGDEGERAVGEDSDLVRLRDDGDGSELLERGCIVDGEGGGAAIQDDDLIVVGSSADGDGFGAGFGTAENAAGCWVDGDELVIRGGGGVDAIAGGREIDSVG